MTSTPEILHRSVVVFSQNYLPISRVNIKRAIILLVTGKAEPLNFGVSTPTISWSVRSANKVLQVPEHIRLTISGIERIWKIPPVNRREILKRDNNTCQYCGSKKHLTLDHVIPRSKGGLHTWDNVVAACEKCNAHKGDRTPQQAGMPLLKQPRAPMHPTVAFAENFWQEQKLRE